MKPKSSRDLPLHQPPKKDAEREDARARVKDADKTDVADRDLVHGDGGTIDIPVKPSDIAKDD